MDTLTFKRHLVPYVVPEEAVYLVSERGVTAVQGELAAALAPLLDGTRAAEEIVAELAELYPAERVRRHVHRRERFALPEGVRGASDPSRAEVQPAQLVAHPGGVVR